MNVNINGRNIFAPDGANISVVNGVIYVNNERYDVPITDKELRIEISGGVAALQVDRGNVEVSGDVQGKISAGGSVTVKGKVEGSVDAGGSVNCGDIQGDVEAGGSINCGDVQGDVEAGGSIVRN